MRLEQLEKDAEQHQAVVDGLASKYMDTIEKLQSDKARLEVQQGDPTGFNPLLHEILHLRFFKNSTSWSCDMPFKAPYCQLHHKIVVLYYCLLKNFELN